MAVFHSINYMSARWCCKGVKGRAFNACRFTPLFFEKLLHSGARVKILWWVTTASISSFAVNAYLMSWGETEMSFPSLHIYVQSLPLETVSALLLHFSSILFVSILCLLPFSPSSSAFLVLSKPRSGRVLQSQV